MLALENRLNACQYRTLLHGNIAQSIANFKLKNKNGIIPYVISYCEESFFLVVFIHQKTSDGQQKNNWMSVSRIIRIVVCVCWCKPHRVSF